MKHKPAWKPPQRPPCILLLVLTKHLKVQYRLLYINDRCTDNNTINIKRNNAKFFCRNIKLYEGQRVPQRPKKSHY